MLAPVRPIVLRGGDVDIRSAQQLAWENKVLVMVERVQVADLTKDDEHVAGLQLEVAGGVGDQLPVGTASSVASPMR